MMNKTLYISILILLSSLCSLAQNIPALPQDAAVARGVLADGVNYYIASNPSDRGQVEYALVRKLPVGVSRDSVIMAAREKISGMRCFGRRTAKDFLTDHGVDFSVSAAKGKLVEFKEDALIYHFGKIENSDIVADSLILMIFNIMESDSAVAPSTSDYALIIAGDVNRDVLLTKLRYISLMVPPRGNAVTRSEYQWNADDRLKYTALVDSVRNTVTLSFTYTAPRIPIQYMNTTITTVSDYLGGIFGDVLKRRIGTGLKESAIPYGSMDFRYTKSSETGGDEKYRISVTTDAAFADAVTEIVASTLVGIQTEGVGEKELADMRKTYLFDLYRQANNTIKNNNDYVNECIASFLYGADLATKNEELKFLIRGELADSTNARIFNDFAAKILNANTEISPDLLTEQSENSAAFDSLSLPAAFSEKIKLTSARKEPVSGGNFWVFSNGIKVVYKRMATQNLFYYEMMIRGGYSEMKDIKKGEGAFLADMLETYDIAGLTSKQFDHLLQSSGITMSSRIGVSDMSIYGVATKPALGLLTDALAAVAYNRTIETRNFDYYRECELIALREREGSRLDRLAIMDGLLCPSYHYSSHKSAEAIYPDLQQRAMQFFNNQFARVNDGVLIIVGDMEEMAMRKFLQENLGKFRTQIQTEAKIRLPYQPVSGGTTHIVEGDEPSVDVIMSAQTQFSAENYMTARVAEEAVRDAVSKALCGYGAVVRVMSDFTAFPQERVNVLISIDNVGLESQPLNEQRTSPLALLGIVRQSIDKLASEPLPAAKLNAYKAKLNNEITVLQGSPEYWRSMIYMRYALGKDLNTKYAERINAVSAEKLQAMIASLNTSSKVEYVVGKSFASTAQTFKYQ